MKRIFLTAALAAAVLWLGATPAAAEPRKRQDLKATASQIAETVKALAGGQPVRLGSMTAVGAVFDAGSGLPSLELELNTALAGDLDQKKANIEVRCEIRYANADGIEGKVIKVKAVVENLDNNKILREFEVPILYVADIGKMTGVQGNLAPKGSSEDARKGIEQNLKNPPKVEVAAGTLISTVKTASYQVEIRAKKDGAAGPTKPRPARVVDGLPFVTIEAGEVYEVRVLNRSKQEAAFTLAIDGIDQFAFTENRTNGQPAFGHIILPPAAGGVPGETTVYGWHKKFNEVESKHQYFEFLTTQFGKGNILNKPKAKVGMIELQFSHSFVADKEARTRGDVETSNGKIGEVSGKVVQRFINPAEDFITIRYNREIK